MPNRALSPRTLIAAAAIGALALLTPFAQAQDDTYRGPGAIPDPGTYEGSRQIQEQQQQQDQQYRDQQQQQWNQGSQSGQDQPQYYGQQQTFDNGPFGAIFFDPLHPATHRTSYNYPSPHAAAAAARGACSQVAGHPCREALEFHDTCAAMASSRNGPWAARAASSVALARDMALNACQKAGGQACASKYGYCSPNPD